MVNNQKYKKVRNEVKKLVKEASFAPENYFTDTVWDYHIKPVVEHALILGKKLDADLQILELSALLHDYASLLDKDMYKEHHIHGARLAKKILDKYEMPHETIDSICDCIYSHRGSIKIKKNTLEAEIIASADAMSHITELADMMYLTYGVHKYKTREGADWLLNKINRSWQKIMPEGKELIKEDYENAVKILARAVK